MINTKNCDIIIMGGMGPMAGLELHKLLITLNKNVKKDQDHKSILHLSLELVFENPSNIN